MKKNFLQDVIPPTQRRSIRDIPLPNSKKSSRQEVSVDERAEDEKSNIELDKSVKEHVRPNTPSDVRPKVQDVERADSRPPVPPPYRFDNSSFEEKPKKKKIIIASAILVLLVGFLILNNPKAEVIIYPKTERVFIQSEYAISDKNLNIQDGELGYKILKIEKESSFEAEASGEQEVSQKSSGNIKIFNEYSTKEQKLVEKTRFETSKGLVYRIAESVSVPGYTEQDGKIIPGEIEVEVFADEPGEKFNIESAEFTIPGFDGLPQFEKMYARTTSSISGGFVGVKKVVSEEDKNLALENLKSKVKDLILEEIRNLGDDFVIVFNEDDINYSSISETDTKDGVELKIKASIDSYVFNTKELARFIVDKEMLGSPEGEVTIKNKSDLSFGIEEETIEDTEGEEQMRKNLTIEGEAEIQWLLDAEDLVQKISGKKQEELKNIILDNKGIIKGESKITPMWRNTFPKPSKIEVFLEQ